MSASLLDGLTGLVTPDLLKSVAGSLGEPEAGVGKAMGAAFPALLGGLLQGSGDGGLMDKIAGLVGDKANDGGLLSNLGGAGGLLSLGGSGSVLGGLGGTLLTLLFGNKLGGIVEAVAKMAGIKGPAVSTLLKYAAPMVLAMLRKRMGAGAVTGKALSSLIGGERQAITAALPSGLMSAMGIDAGSLGTLGNVGGTVRQAAAGATAAAGHAASAAKVGTTAIAARSGMGWLPWLLAGLVALAGLWWWQGRTPARVEVPVPAKVTAAPAVPAAPAKVVTTPAAPAPAAAPAASASATVAAAVGSLVKRQLPGNFTIEFPQTSLESRLIGFIEDKTKPIEATTWFDIDRLNFQTGSAALTDDSKAQVANMGQILKAYPTVKIKIGGYTDNVGDPAKNLGLSDERAKAVLAALTALGIAGDRLEAQGYGEQHPVADNATADGRARNRRIAVRVNQR